jgi:hypothetical protein
MFVAAAQRAVDSSKLDCDAGPVSCRVNLMRRRCCLHEIY